MRWSLLLILVTVSLTKAGCLRRDASFSLHLVPPLAESRQTLVRGTESISLGSVVTEKDVSSAGCASSFASLCSRASREGLCSPFFLP